jgi:hydrogenase-4 membrane subunit HyfE
MVVIMAVVVAMVMMMVVVIMRVGMVMIAVRVGMRMAVLVAMALLALALFALGLFAFQSRRPASANRAHYSTSNSLTRISSPLVICTL